MNIYEKLQLVRTQLNSEKLRKSGENRDGNYRYFELDDFLPKAMQLFAVEKLFSQVSFHPVASLTIVNVENPEERVVFESPMAEAKLKGAQPIQNLGAAQTYMRRYLYVTALEIVENDPVDAGIQREKTEDRFNDAAREAEYTRREENGNGSSISESEPRTVRKGGRPRKPKRD